MGIILERTLHFVQKTSQSFCNVPSIWHLKTGFAPSTGFQAFSLSLTCGQTLRSKLANCSTQLCAFRNLMKNPAQMQNAKRLETSMMFQNHVANLMCQLHATVGFGQGLTVTAWPADRSLAKLQEHKFLWVVSFVHA